LEFNGRLTVRNMRERLCNYTGFTLVELLVVISIISLLSSIVFSSVNSARVKARDAKTVADISQLVLALNFAADTSGGVFPSSGGTWRCLGQTPAGQCWFQGGGPYTGLDSLNNALTPYINPIPRDPNPEAGCHGQAFYLYHSNYNDYAGVGTYIHWGYENTATQCPGRAGVWSFGCGPYCILYVGPPTT